MYMHKIIHQRMGFQNYQFLLSNDYAIRCVDTVNASLISTLTKT